MKDPFQAVKVTDKVYWVGAIDWDLRDFHGYATRRGTTYNAYPASIGALYDSSGAQYIDSILASGSKQGYNFSVSGDQDNFNASAVPSKPNVTGSRYFFLDQNGVIRASNDGPADMSSPAL